MSIYLDAIGDENVSNLLKQLEARITALEAGTINNVEQLDDIALDLGVIQSGEFRAGEGTPDDGFCGVRMAYPAMEYTVSGSAQSFNVVGVNNDVLQFGLDAASGAAIAGGGIVKLDENGIGINVQPSDVWDDPLAYSFHNPTQEGDNAKLGGMIALINPDDNLHSLQIQSYHSNHNSDGYADLTLSAQVGEVSFGALSITADLTGAYGTFSTPDDNFKLMNIGPVHVIGSIRESTPLGCRVYRNSTQAINATTYTALSWNTEISDTDDCWAISSPTKMVCKTAGYYMAGASIYTNSVNTSLLTINVNGHYKAITSLSGNRGAISTGMIYLEVNDYVEAFFYSYVAGCTVLAASATNDAYNCGWLARIA